MIVTSSKGIELRTFMRDEHGAMRPVSTPIFYDGPDYPESETMYRAFCEIHTSPEGLTFHALGFAKLH